MARKRKEDGSIKIELKQPDRSGPTGKTLLQIAEERGLWDKAKKREDALAKEKENVEDDDLKLPPGVERVMDTLLWSLSLSMLHFTLDVLVHHQYSINRIVWSTVCIRAAQALLVFGVLVYVLHPHPSSTSFVPGLPRRLQEPLRQAIFFFTSVCAGCYLIHITNMYGYMAVMKQAPPIGCLWIWSVIELKLQWAVLSVAATGTFLWQRGYSIK